MPHPLAYALKVPLWPFQWGYRTFRRRLTDRATLLREGAQVVTPVIETAERRVGPVAATVGTVEEIRQRLNESLTVWDAQRTALLTYANFHPSDQIRGLAHATDDAVTRAFGAARYLSMMQATAEAYTAFQDAEARHEEAKRAAQTLMQAIRDY